MNARAEDRVPWPRLQKQAAFGLPLMLVGGAVTVAHAFTGPFHLPLWGKLFFLVPMLALLLAMIILPRRSECPDERDLQFVLKSTRRGYMFLMLVLFLPFALRHIFWPGSPTWDVENLAVGLILLAQAVYFGSILLLYRGGGVN